MSAPFNVTVTTTVTRIVDYSSKRTVVMIYNNSSVVIYVGVGKGLTTQNGFPIAPNQGAVFAREFGDDPTLSYYAVAESGTADVRVWEGFGKTLGTLIQELINVMKR